MSKWCYFQTVKLLHAPTLPEPYLSSTTSDSTETTQFLSTTTFVSQCLLQQFPGSVCLSTCARPACWNCFAICFTNISETPSGWRRLHCPFTSHPCPCLFPSLLTLLTYFHRNRQSLSFSRISPVIKLTLWSKIFLLYFSLQEPAYFIFCLLSSRKLQTPKVLFKEKIPKIRLADGYQGVSEHPTVKPWDKILLTFRLEHFDLNQSIF